MRAISKKYSNLFCSLCLILTSCLSLDGVFIDGPARPQTSEAKIEKPHRMTLKDFISMASVEAPFDLYAKTYTGFANEVIYQWYDDFTFYREEYYMVDELISKKRDGSNNDSDSNYYRDIRWQWNCAVLSYVAPVYKEFVQKKQAEKEEEYRAKNTFDKKDFYLVPEDFTPSLYEEIDLF